MAGIPSRGKNKHPCRHLPCTSLPYPGPTLEQVAAAREGRGLAAALVYRHLRARGSSIAGEVGRQFRVSGEGEGPELEEVVGAWTLQHGPQVEVDLTQEGTAP